MAAASDLISRPPFPAAVALADAGASERRRWRRPGQPPGGPRLREDDEKPWFSGIHRLSAARPFSPSRRRKPGLLASGVEPQLSLGRRVHEVTRGVEFFPDTSEPAAGSPLRRVRPLGTGGRHTEGFTSLRNPGVGIRSSRSGRRDPNRGSRARRGSSTEPAHGNCYEFPAVLV